MFVSLTNLIVDDKKIINCRIYTHLPLINDDIDRCVPASKEFINSAVNWMCHTIIVTVYILMIHNEFKPYATYYYDVLMNVDIMFIIIHYISHYISI